MFFLLVQRVANARFWHKTDNIFFSKLKAILQTSASDFYSKLQRTKFIKTFRRKKNVFSRVTHFSEHKTTFYESFRISVEKQNPKKIKIFEVFMNFVYILIEKLCSFD